MAPRPYILRGSLTLAPQDDGILSASCPGLTRASIFRVMPGLVPGIHVFGFRQVAIDVDGRNKPARSTNLLLCFFLAAIQ
jgi:hypothetical protein